MFISNTKVILTLSTSGLLEHVPKLNFVSVESGARRLNKRSFIECFKRRIYASFWLEGRDAASSIRRVGVDNIPLD